MKRQRIGRVGAALLFLSALIWADHAAHAQPVTWNYQFGPDGTAEAHYPGRVYCGLGCASQNQSSPINIVQPPYSADPTGVTDDTAAFAAAIVAGCTTGARIYAPAGTYLIHQTGVLNVTCSKLGFEGDGPGITTLETDQPTGDIIDFTGASFGVQIFDYMHNLTLTRTVPPTIGDTGANVRVTNDSYFIFDHVNSSGSHFNFYQVNSPDTLYLVTNATPGWSYQGAGDLFVGYRVTGNLGNYSTEFIRAFSFNPIGGGASWSNVAGSGYGRWIDGAWLSDIHSTASENDDFYYGTYFDLTGAGSTLNWDNIFTQDRSDTFAFSGFYITGGTASSQVTIQGGWMNPGSTGVPNQSISIRNNQGTTVSGVQFFGPTSGATQNIGVYATNSGSISVLNNQFKYMAFGVDFDNAGGIVTQSLISNNQFSTDSTSHPMTDAILLVGTTRTNVVGNSVTSNTINAITSGIVGTSTPTSDNILSNNLNPTAFTGSIITGFTVVANDNVFQNQGFNAPSTPAALDLPDQTQSGGANLTAFSIGTVTSGTTTIDCGKNPAQYLTNGGAFTLAAPANDGECMVLDINNGSAGAITFSGFSVGSNTGDALTTTNGNKFTISIWRIDGTAGYRVAAHQ